MTSVAIFGASSAIAEQVARLYAAQEARLFLVGRDPVKLEAIAADLRARGAELVDSEIFDFEKADGIGALLDAMRTRFGIPDKALIAYGTLPDQASCATNDAFARQALELNFLSPVLLLQGLARLMEAGGGAIAAIGSVAGDRGRASNYIYGSAKGGLGLFAQGLAHALARGGRAKPLGIVLVKPGFVDTPMTAAFPKGPLWAAPADVAGEIHAALEHGRSTIIYTPWFWRFILLIIRLLPQPVIHRTKL